MPRPEGPLHNLKRISKSEGIKHHLEGRLIYYKETQKKKRKCVYGKCPSHNHCRQECSGQGPTYINHAFLFSVFSSILTSRALRKLERPPFLVLIPRESKQLKMTTLSQANHPILKAHTLNSLLYLLFTLGPLSTHPNYPRVRY